MDRSGWKSRYRGAFRSRKNLDLGWDESERWSATFPRFSGMQRQKSPGLAKGELTNGWDLSDATGERERFSSEERGWSTLRALSNCIPERHGAERTSSSNFSRGVEILIDDFHKRTNVGRSMLVGDVGKGGEERTWWRKLCSVRSRGKRHVRRVVAFLAAHSPGETIRKTREK